MIKLRKYFVCVVSHVCFWYQISGTRNPATGTRNWYQILVPVFWYQFLVPVSGQYVMGISLMSLARVMLSTVPCAEFIKSGLNVLRSLYAII